MGSCQSKNSDVVAPESTSIREVKVVVLGLDNSGKSTLLANLNGESTDGITPTVGFSSTKLSVDGVTMTLYDVGGGPRIRGIWSNYFSEAYGIIYVVDSSSPDRFSEAADALRSVMSHDRVEGKPLLVLANKQDLNDACNEAQLTTAMALGEMIPEEKLQVIKCTALKRSSSSKSDPALRRGLSWLLGRVMGCYDELEERVKCDVSVQREREATERRERMERVRRMREEREKAQQTEGIESVDSAERCPANPFKPISVVAVEVAQREAASRPPATKAHSTPGQLTGDVTRDKGGPNQGRDGGSTVSQSSSNLSDSDSLTVVTQPSGGSSESLRAVPPLPLDPPAPLDTPRSGSPSVLRRTKLDPIKTKKERKQMLITRLKNRNKTAPAPPPTPPVPYTPHASRDTWTSGELEPVLSSEDPLEGLPPLPSSRRVLPPLSVGGDEQRTFHLEEELKFVPSGAVVQVSHPPSVLT